MRRVSRECRRRLLFVTGTTRSLPLPLLVAVLLLPLAAAAASDNRHRRNHQHTSAGGEEEEERVKPASAYVWKTGAWGSCFSAGAGCGEGEQQRSTWCAHLDGRTTLEFLCDAHDRPPRTRLCFRVCEEHRGHLEWRVGGWGPCLATETDTSELTAPLVPPVLPPPAPPPGVGGGRSSPVSSSSSSSCPDRKGAMSRDVACIYRRHPRSGDNDDHHRGDNDNYHHNVGESQQQHDHPKRVEDEACEQFKRKPKDRLVCQVPCPQDCVVAPFNPWLPCVGCGPGNRTRTRDVLVAPQHGGRPCPQLSESEVCNEAAVACLQSLPPPLPREYRLWVSEWGRCLPSEPPSSEASSPYAFKAAIGYRERDVACRDPNGGPVDMSYCMKGGDGGPAILQQQDNMAGDFGDATLPAKVQSCVVPSDCVMSSWSEWRVVADGCITSHNNVRPELRKRARHVLQLPLGGGKPCPHLEELHRVTEKAQLQPCTKFKWVPSEWGECVQTNQSTVAAVTCGGGIQLRSLTCLRSDDLVPVPQSYCSETPPPTVRRCSIPCRQDCVVSAWSPWEPCRPLDCREPLNSNKIGYRERRRSVVQNPSSSGDNCPPLRQVDLCERPSCYHWKTSAYSPCIVLNKELRCGQGRRTRKAFCVDLEGIRVDEALCGIYVPEPELVVPCYIPCPSDCVLSNWSEWTPCSRICADRDDHGLRSRNRTVLAPAGLGGTPCPNSDELTETEICNLHGCYGFGWKVLSWRPCKVTNPLETCGPGEEVREVWCMRDEDRRVNDKRCLPIPKPEERRPCSVPCPKDCIATKYTDWTVCPDACHAASSAVHTQRREMFVLQSPQKGREPCPEALQEVRGCPTQCSSSSSPASHSSSSHSDEDDAAGATSDDNNAAPPSEISPAPTPDDGSSAVACVKPCFTFQWSLGEWGSCRLPDSVECGIGYRTRRVVCQRNDGKEVEADLCMVGTSQTLPVVSERCHVSCLQSCVHSDWSEWSQCPNNCGGFQVRKRQLLEESAHNEECRNGQQFPVEERQSCPCHVYSARPEGDWSDCVLDGSDELVPINGQLVNGRCGVGKRFRKVACYDKAGNLVDPLLCTPTGYEEDVCMIPCPVDCQMTAWSEWSPCSALCGSGVKQRLRSVARPAYDGGRPCPKLDTRKMEKEVKSCFVSCDKYHWFPYGWTQCELSLVDWGHHCGTGIQTRNVSCMKVDNITRPEQVKEEYCDPMLKPVNMNYCHVPCPMDCVVNDWSDWSPCSQPCDSKHTRRRTREMVREPYDSGDPCPAMSEVEPCILNENCFHYTWNTSEWSSCIIHPNATCGEGLRQRNVLCLRSDGRTVRDSFCEETGVPRPESAESWCSVDCPIDCVVSQWSDWNHSECGSCGTSGHAVRTRQVLVNPSESGRPCPAALVQRKPCQARPCYHWVRTPFTECDLEGSACGHGLGRREVFCQRADGATVAKKYCMEANATGLMHGWMDRRWLESLLDIQEEEPCHVPCPGDCVLSMWSEWSPCHRDCEGGEQGGQQSRSRAVLTKPSPTGEKCPEQLWMTRPCFGGPCYKFDWKIKDNQVICMRSDGIIVQGGCQGRPRPCLPPCRVAHSECSRHGACMCESGYRPTFTASSSAAASRGGEGATTTTRELIGCELMQTTNSSHHTAGGGGGLGGGAGGEIKVIYLPKDTEVSFWMYAMISVGSAFIIFVAVTVYLMCHSSVRHSDSPTRHPASSATGTSRGGAHQTLLTLRRPQQLSTIANSNSHRQHHDTDDDLGKLP